MINSQKQRQLVATAILRVVEALERNNIPESVRIFSMLSLSFYMIQDTHDDVDNVLHKYLIDWKKMKDESTKML